ncbi:MAG: signal peptide peptidase SppA [Acidobacteriota bacterium]
MSENSTPAPRRVRWGLIVALVVVVGLVLAVVLALAGFASLMKGPTVSVKPDSTLVIAFDRPLQELPPNPLFTELFNVKVYSVHEVVTALDRAAGDDRIKGLLLDVGAIPAGFGKIQEIRAAVLRFKKSGKPVWAYFESAGNGGYYLASSADRVFAPPSANLMMTGLLAEVPFYRGVLDKLRVEPQLYHIGEYKSYSDTFMRKDMTEAQREATNAILDSLYGQMVRGIAEGRKVTPESVMAKVDRGFLWGAQLKEEGLVDDLLYRDQLEEALRKANGNDEKWNRVEMDRYIKDHRVDPSAKARKTVALVLASGGIISGEGEGSDGGSGGNVGSATLVNWLRKVGEDKGISAVVLRVDSPGGSGLASDVIWRQVQVLRKSKPVVVSMSDVAASGGYYIAMGSDGIVAQPGTITGSIGVVSGKFVLKGLYDWIDYREEVLKRGANADMLSSGVRFSPEQEKIIEGQMRAFYQDFVSKVAEGRKMSYEDVDRVAQGRIWSGEDALKIGLVDRLGGIPEAMDLAKDKAGIPKDERVRVRVYPRPKTFFESFLEGGAEDMVRARQVHALPPELVRAYTEYEQLRPLASEPFVLVAPAGLPGVLTGPAR